MLTITNHEYHHEKPPYIFRDYGKMIIHKSGISSFNRNDGVPEVQASGKVLQDAQGATGRSQLDAAKKKG